MTEVLATLAPPLVPPLLLATDGSPSAGLAQKLLYPLGKVLTPPTPEQASLVMLTVKPQLLKSQLLPRRRKPVSPEAPDSTEATASLDLSEEYQLLQTLAADVPAEMAKTLTAQSGRPASVILSQARSCHAGLIAVGHKGVETGLRDFLLGSVSLAIAQYASCHVLIARGNETTAGWQHLLLVLEGSQATPQAIALTRQLLPLGVEQVTLLSVQHPLTTQYLFGPFATPSPSWQLIHTLQEAQKEQSQQMLHQAEAELNLPALQLHRLAQVGEPGALICQVAQQQQVGMIILASDCRRQVFALGAGFANDHRRSGLGNVRLNATGNYLIHHAPCPVLLCRSGAPEK